MKDTINYFMRFAQAGYPRLVPVIPYDATISERSSLHKRVGTKQDGRGKTPGTKYNGQWSSFNWTPYEADERDLTRWHAMGAGVGMKTGDGIIAIDADTMDEALAKIIKETVDELIGPTPIRIGNYPKALYLVRCDEPIQYQRIDFGENLERVEILSNGRFFVAQGTHPKTKKPYEWIKPLLPFDQLPIVKPETITKLLETLRTKLPAASKLIKEGGTSEVDQATLRGDTETIRRAVEATPNTSALFPTREAYRDYGYAIKAAVADDQTAFEIYADWAAKWTDGDNDPGVVEADWRRMKPPFRRGATWIYDLADKYSDGKFNSAEVWFSDLTNDDNPFAKISENAFGNSKEKRKFEFLKFSDVAADGLTTNPALIKGLLDQGAMSVLYGDSNVGKTFVAMDMAFHIGAGLNYAGLRTKAGRVVYIAAEGGNGAKKRVVALRDKFPGLEPDFVLLPASVDLRRADADLVPLVEALRGMGGSVALLVIDTLSRAMAGGDENSSVDMGALVKNVDALRKAIAPAHLMLVHHTGKDKARGARGHSLLRAATDTEIEVADGVIGVTKQRDNDKSWSSGFGLEVRTLGVDDDGDVITSCTVRLESLSAVRVGEMTDGEKAVMTVIELMYDLSTSQGKGIKIAALKEAVKDDMSVNALNSHIRNLVKKGLILRETRGWLKLAENIFS